jgi:hypothetical protein
MSQKSNRIASRDLRPRSLILSVLTVLLAIAIGMQTPARADQGCEDMRQLCKDAKANTAKCTKQEKGDASSCKPLVDISEATCTQAEIICKPPVGEPK